MYILYMPGAHGVWKHVRFLELDYWWLWSDMLGTKVRSSARTTSSLSPKHLCSPCLHPFLFQPALCWLVSHLVCFPVIVPSLPESFLTQGESSGQRKCPAGPKQPCCRGVQARSQPLLRFRWSSGGESRRFRACGLWLHLFSPDLGSLGQGLQS